MAAKRKSRAPTAPGRAAPRATPTHPAARRAADLPPQTTPLCLYVAWHPDSPDGDHLASEIFRWFRGDPRNLETCGTGIPVLFRRWRGDAHGAPRPVDLPPVRGGGKRVVVPLLDEHFVTTRLWRSFLHRNVGRARRTAPNTMVLPVALHPGAYQIAGQTQWLNFLRADGADAPAVETDRERRQRRTARVVRQLTGALGRMLTKDGSLDLAGAGPLDPFAGQPAKVTVFVSHAKRDGAAIAARLRDEIQRRDQLRAFFDENDLAHGYDWARGLDDALVANEAMVVVLSDSYASRPWCRRELRTMRTLKLVQRPSADAAGIVRASPCVVVDALDRGSTNHVPDVGPAPVYRLAPGEDGDRIVDAVQRAVLEHAYAVRVAQDLSTRLPGAERTRTWFVNAAPDLRTIAQVRALHGRGPMRLAFPGPGITADVLVDWQALFPDTAFERFDDLADRLEEAP